MISSRRRPARALAAIPGIAPAATRGMVHFLARAVTLMLLFAVHPAHGQEQGETPPEGEGAFMLNLQETSLRTLIRTVSEQTGRNFIVDPRVNATVTVISSTPVGDRELYDVFLSVLDVYGYSAVPTGDVTRIVPTVAATKSSIPVGGERGGPQLVTRVLTVEHINPAQLVPVLRPLIPQEGHLAAYAPTGTLIITDTAANVQRLVQIIDRVDRPIESGIDVIELNHASAQEVVRILSSLRGAQEGPGGLRLAADTRSNRILVSGPPAARLRMRALIANLDTPLERQGNTRVTFLNYADAEELADILDEINQARAEARGNGEAAPVREGGVIILPDPATNSLILTGPPERLDSLQSIIHQLDIPRAQVLVEAIIVEVSQDKDREFGVQFIYDGSDSDDPAAVTNFNNLAGLIANPAAAIGSGLTAGVLDQGAGSDFGLIVRALAADASNNILSTPSIVTLDNTEAEIVVGQNVPFVTGSFTSGDVDQVANPFQTIERRDVGITLQVEPQINEGGIIKMRIHQEVSSIAAAASGASAAADLITNKRALTTTVLVEDGQTLVLGGLIDETVRTTNSRVPLLGSIPVIGWLFRYQTTSKVKQNLMVFLHPTILKDRDVANFYTGSKYSYMRQRQLERIREGDPLMIDELPVLPELNLEHEAMPMIPSGSIEVPRG